MLKFLKSCWLKKVTKVIRFSEREISPVARYCALPMEASALKP
jgi:hypothetical protein